MIVGGGYPGSYFLEFAPAADIAGVTDTDGRIHGIGSGGATGQDGNIGRLFGDGGTGVLGSAGLTGRSGTS